MKPNSCFDAIIEFFELDQVFSFLLRRHLPQDHIQLYHLPSYTLLNY